MDKVKLEIDLPESVYEKLGAFIVGKVDEAFNRKTRILEEQRRKLTRTEAAKHLRISLPTLDKLKSDGVLNYQRIGKRILFSEEELENYLKRSYML